MTGRLIHSFHLVRLGALAIVSAAAVACSNPSSNLVTGPSGIPGPLQAGGGGSGGTVRYYGATIGTTPTPIPAGSTSVSFSITIENCDGSVPCDGAHVTSQNQAIGQAHITVPSEFTGVDNVQVTTSNPSDQTWQIDLDDLDTLGLIRVFAPAGNKRLDKGESVTVTFTANAPCVAGTYWWNTAAFQDPDSESTVYELVGSQPSVAVIGSCVTECTVKGQGYWEHHFGDWPEIGTGLMLGSVLYTPDQLLDILEQNPVAGNGLIALAHQLISAKLNIANGENGASIASTIAAADALIGNLLVPPVGAGSIHPSQTGDLTQALDDFNTQCED